MSQSTARWRQPAVGRLALGISLGVMTALAWLAARQATAPVLMWDTALHWLAGVALGAVASVWWDGEGVVLVTGIGAASWEIFEIGYPGPAEFLHGSPPASMVAHDTLLDVLAVVGGGLMVVWLARQHNE